MYRNPKWTFFLCVFGLPQTYSGITVGCKESLPMSKHLKESQTNELQRIENL